MRRVVSPFLWVLVLQAAATSGCNEVTVSNTAPLELVVSSLDEPLGDPVPLVGAELCPTGNTANCVRTGERGEATIELPTGDSSFTIVAAGHVPYLVPVLMPHLKDYDLKVRTTEYMEAQFANLMIDYPMGGKGAILVFRFNGAKDATFELEGTTAIGPFYADEDGWWSLDLTQTTEVGLGGFVEVPPGERYTIHAGGTAQDCSAWWGWSGEEANSYRVPVQANSVTYVSLLCYPNKIESGGSQGHPRFKGVR